MDHPKSAVSKSQSLRSRARDAWVQQLRNEKSEKNEKGLLARSTAGKQPRASSLMVGSFGAKENNVRSLVSLFMLKIGALKGIAAYKIMY